MVVHNVSLARVAVGKKNFPEDGLPEIAFAGRSNVGKSSLINAMVNRKALARTSSQPGKTRTINFYNVENALYLVDLPGYGYAKASRTSVREWGRMAESYLKSRYTLKMIVLVIDSRHTPSEKDMEMLEFLRYYGRRIVIVATKTDKLNRSEIPVCIALIKTAFDLSDADVLIPFSAETKTGADALWQVIETD